MYPSLKANRMLRVLTSEPLAYHVTRRRGSHRVLESTRGYPKLVFSFHERVTLAPGVVRKILVGDVGLTEDEALRLVGAKR